MPVFKKISGIEKPVPYENLRSFDIFHYSDEVDMKDSLGELNIVLLNPFKELLAKGIKNKIISVFRGRSKIENQENFKEALKAFIIEELIEISEFDSKDIDLYIDINI